MNGQLVTEDKIPSYRIIEENIRQIDSNIIIARIFYMFNRLTYRFQLIRKDKMCMIEISKKLIDNLKNDNPASQQELTDILKSCLKGPGCWTEVER